MKLRLDFGFGITPGMDMTFHDGVCDFEVPEAPSLLIQALCAFRRAKLKPLYGIKLIFYKKIKCETRGVKRAERDVSEDPQKKSPITP